MVSFVANHNTTVDQLI